MLRVLVAWGVAKGEHKGAWRQIVTSVPRAKACIQLVALIVCFDFVAGV